MFVGTLPLWLRLLVVTNNEVCVALSFQHTASLTFVFMLFLVILSHDVSIIVFYTMVTKHVKTVGNMIKNAQHTERRLTTLKRHAFSYCSIETIITACFVSMFLINSTDAHNYVRIISFLIYIVTQTLLHNVVNSFNNIFSLKK